MWRVVWRVLGRVVGSRITSSAAPSPRASPFDFITSESATVISFTGTTAFEMVASGKVSAGLESFGRAGFREILVFRGGLTLSRGGLSASAATTLGPRELFW